MLVCTLLSPIVSLMRWLPNVMDATLYGKYKYYDFHITSLREFLGVVYGNFYIYMIISLIFLFIPCQLIKDFCYRKGYHLNFLKRTGILFGVIFFWIVVTGIISFAITTPWYDNCIFVVCIGGASLFYGTILHFMVDRYQHIH